MSMKSLKTPIFLFFLLLISTSSFSQYTEVINSNRPGVSRSAFSVGTNVIQFEAGPYIIKEKRTPFPENEVSGFGIDYAARYGFLLEQLEVSLEGTFQSDTKTITTSSSRESKRGNFRYNTLGFKYLVYDPYKNAGEDKPNLYSWKANRKFKWKSLIPAVAVYAGANFDTKDNPYIGDQEGGFSPKGMIVTQNNFSSGWVLVMNFIGDRFGTDFPEFQYIVTMTKAINEKFVVFGETQGIKSDFYADNLFRLGGAYLFGKDFQLDTALTFNAKDTPSVFSVNFGMSYRIDRHQDKKIDNNTEKKGKKVKGKKKKDPLEEGAKKKKKKKKRKTDFDDSL